MNAHVAELQAAVKGQTLPWVAFPDKPVALATGSHSGQGYVLRVALTVYAWEWAVTTGTTRHTGRAPSAVEALDAANEAYARFAAELHEAGAA